MLIPIEYLRERLTCDAETGELRWKSRPGNTGGWNAKYAGKIAGVPRTDGYLHFGLRYNGKDKYLKVHRVVFAMTHGRWPTALDHKNRVPSDNTLSNLREITQAQNLQNIVRQGVRAYPHGYRAQIHVNKKEIHLGCFKTKAEARYAYLTAKTQYHLYYVGD
jgi:hypothetical protein